MRHTCRFWNTWIAFRYSSESVLPTLTNVSSDLFPRLDPKALYQSQYSFYGLAETDASNLVLAGGWCWPRAARAGSGHHELNISYSLVNSVYTNSQLSQRRAKTLLRLCCTLSHALFFVTLLAQVMLRFTMTLEFNLRRSSSFFCSLPFTAKPQFSAWK